MLNASTSFQAKVKEEGGKVNLVAQRLVISSAYSSPALLPPLPLPPHGSGFCAVIGVMMVGADRLRKDRIIFFSPRPLSLIASSGKMRVLYLMGV